MLVDFFIVGAPKCGTTALSQYLSERKEISFSTPKEPHYFATDMPKYRYVTDLKDYHGLFANDGQLKGEGSVWYLYSKTALKNIHSYNPNAKIIVMLRNPVEMVVSAHSQLLCSMDEHIKEFPDAWDSIQTRKRGTGFNKLSRFHALLFYDEIAKYGSQLDRLYTIFDRENVHVILFDDFKDNTRYVYEDTIKFLGLDKDNRQVFPVVNANTSLKCPLVSRTLASPGSFVLRFNGFCKKLGFSFGPLAKIITTKNVIETKRKDISLAYKRKIFQAYGNDIEKLEKIIGRDLSAWKIIHPYS